MTIVVCEPQCWDFEHANFNAALLQVVLLAFPEARVVFLGERSHVGWVESALARSGAAVPSRLTFETLPIPRPELVHWGRFTLSAYRQDRAWTRELRGALRRQGADLLVLASVTGTGLFAWKASQWFRPGVPTVAIPHAILGTIARAPRLKLPALAQRPRWWRDLRHLAVRLRLGPASSLLLARAATLRRIVRLPPAKSIRYVALGPSIERALQELDPPLAARFDVMDLPAFPREDGGPDAMAIPGVVRFGFFGVGYKGFASFARLASAVRPRHGNARFDLVGFLNTPEEPSSYEGAVEGVSTTALSPEEFERRAAAVTYAVWTADPARYRYAASATFVDALCFGKPGIYLRNPFVEHYFERLGDVGYLCDSLDHAREVVESILARFPLERYRAQRRAIVAGRRMFAPAAQAAKMREIARRAATC
jgi:hypothetical protein